MPSCGCSPNGPGGNSTPASVPDLAALGLLTGVQNGDTVYVLDQSEPYRLEQLNTFAPFSPLIVPAAGAGNWFRRSVAYVVANTTFWACGTGTTAASNKILGFTPGQLLVSNPAIVPDIVLDLSAIVPANSFISELCTDLQGNLWFAAESTAANGPGHGFKIALHDTLRSGTPTPVVDIAGTTPANDSRCSTIAFDKQNNLWLGGTSRFRKIGQYQAVLSGAPPPLVVLAGSVAWSTLNRYMGFDQDGNLWFTNSFGGTAQISKVTPAQYAATNLALVPSVIWSGSNILAVQDFAIGPLGLLWVVEYVAGAGNGVLKAFDMTQPTGNPAPVRTITSATFSGPVALAFDGAGNLWIGNNDNGTLMRFDRGDLATSGVKVPSVVLHQTIVTPLASAQFALNPMRVGLAPSGVPATL